MNEEQIRIEVNKLVHHIDERGIPILHNCPSTPIVVKRLELIKELYLAGTLINYVDPKVIKTKKDE